MQWTDRKREEALDLLERGFLLSPTTTDSVTLYYNAIVSLAEFSRAELIFREAKSLHPRNKRVFFLFIDLLLQQGKYHEAMQEVEEALLTFDIDDGLIPAALQIREKIGLQQLPAPPLKRATLSLCLIVKDEETHLAKCLMSAKDIADEMIVVDTGSIGPNKRHRHRVRCPGIRFRLDERFFGSQKFFIIESFRRLDSCPGRG